MYKRLFERCLAMILAISMTFTLNSGFVYAQEDLPNDIITPIVGSSGDYNDPEVVPPEGENNQPMTPAELVGLITRLSEQAAAGEAPNPDEVLAARAAYDALTEEQKAAFDPATLALLVALEGTDKQPMTPEEIAGLITRLTEQKNAGEVPNPDEVLAARAAYEALTEEQKAAFDPATLALLVALEGESKQPMTPEEIAGLITRLTEQKNAGEVPNPDEVLAARAAYEALTEEQKASFDPATLALLVALEGANKQPMTPEEIVELINRLVEQAEAGETPNADEVRAARAAYDALTDEQKAAFDPDALAMLEMIEAAMKAVLLSADTVELDPNDRYQGVKYTIDTVENTASISYPQMHEKVIGENGILRIPSHVIKGGKTYPVTRIPYSLSLHTEIGDVFVPETVTEIDNIAFSWFARKVYVTLEHKGSLPTDIPAGAFKMMGSKDQSLVYVIIADNAVARDLGEKYNSYEEKYGMIVTDDPERTSFTSANGRVRIASLPEDNIGMYWGNYEIKDVDKPIHEGLATITTTSTASGYESFIDVGSGPSYVNSKRVRLPGEGVESYVSDGIWCKVTAEPYGDYLRVTYTLRNSTDADISDVSLGVGANILIGGNSSGNFYNTPIGLRMVHTKDSWKEFSINCKNIDGADDVTTMWYGNDYMDYRNNLFSDLNNKTDGTYSYVAFSWQGMKIPAGQTITRSVLHGRGAPKAPVIFTETDHNPITLTLKEAGKKDVTAEARVSDVAGYTDTFYYSINDGERQKLGDPIPADGSIKVISGVIAGTNFAKNGPYTIKLWVENQRGGKSDVITKEITVTGGVMGGDGLETDLSNAYTVKVNGGNEFSGGTLIKAVQRSHVNDVAVTELEVIKGTMTDADWNALKGYTGMKTFTLGESVIAPTIPAQGNGDVSEPVITKLFSDSIETVNIYTETVVGDYAFYKLPNLKTVNMTKATVVGDYAFASCGKLLTVDLPKVDKTSSYMFAGCTSLRTVDIPESTVASSHAFENCYNLALVNMPKITFIGDSAFASCQTLERVSFPEVTVIVSNAFSNCSRLKAINFPKVKVIEYRTFMGCTNLKEISLPLVENIVTEAFASCGFTKLDENMFPSLTEIYWSAFYRCPNLVEINLPKVTRVEATAFQDCIKLSKVSLPGITRIYEGTFSGCVELSDVSGGFGNVTQIGDEAFKGCAKLTKIDVHSLISEYDDERAIGIGKEAFYGCTALAEMTVYQTPPKVDTGAFDNGAAVRSLSFMGRDGNLLTGTALTDAQARYKNYNDSSMPSDGMGTDTWFGWSIIPSVAIKVNDDETTYSGANLADAVRRCGSVVITKLAITKGKVTAADWKALATTLPALTHFTIAENVTVVNIPDNLGQKVTFPTSIVEVTVPQKITIGMYAFANCDKLTLVSLPKATAIGASAFNGCTSLKSVSIPDAASIGDNAFVGCALEDAAFPNAITIGKNAFEGCALENAAFPKVKVIGDNAFNDCKALKNVSFPETITIGNGAFSGCTALDNASFPVAVTISANLFTNCAKLTSVSFPRLKTIGADAFKGCTALASLTVGAEPPTTASDYDFKDCATPRSIELVDQFGSALTGAALTGAQNKYDQAHSPSSDGKWYGWTVIVIPLITIKVNDDSNYYLGMSLADAVKNSGKEVITKLNVTDGEITTNDWKALSTTLPELTSFTSDYWVDIADIPDCTEQESIFPATIASVIVLGNVEIGDYAFSNCDKLSYVKIPKTEAIGTGTFNGCTSFATFYIGATPPTVATGAFESCPTTRALRISDVDGSLLTGVKLIAAHAAYKAVNDSAMANEEAGNDTWYGWEIAPLQITVKVNDTTVASGIDLSNAVTISGVDKDQVTTLNITQGIVTAEDWKTIRRLSALTNLTINEEVTVADIPLSDYSNGSFSNTLVSVEVPQEIAVGEDAFSKLKNLEKVSLPNATSIGESAFSGCTALTTVDISSATTIEMFAFINCAQLTALKFEGATDIGYKAFGGCTKLAKLTLPQTLVTIGEGAFISCKGLAEVIIPSSVTTIGEDAFTGCTGLTTLTISEGVTTIGESAFKNCTGLTGLTIPEGVTNIGYNAFGGCTKLGSVTISAGITNMGTNIFSSCTGLTEVALLEGVTNIGSYMFAYCTGLTTVTFPKTVTDIADNAFNGCTNLNTVTILGEVNTIGELAFANCTKLETLRIVATPPKSLARDAFKEIPYGYLNFVDENNNRLIGEELAAAQQAYKEKESSITWKGWWIEAPPEIYIKVNNDATLYGGVTLADAVGKTGAAEITKLTITMGKDNDKSMVTTHDWNSLATILPALTDFTIAERVTVADIPNGTSASSIFPASIVNVTVPQSIEIGDYAFYGCDKLETASLPGATSVGNLAFSGCTVLNMANVKDADSIGSSAFNGCTALANLDVSGVNTIGNSAFKGCTGLTKRLLIPFATSIGVDAFKGCTGLPELGISGNVQYIGYGAFQDCTGLTTVNVSKEGPAIAIGSYSFSGCTKLNAVTIRKAVTSIANSAFEYCTGLTSMTILGAIDTIGSGAFSNCSELTTLRIVATPPKLVGDNVFAGITLGRLSLVDENDNLLTDDALAASQAAYTAVDDGSTTDNLWYGWTIVPPPAITIKVNDTTASGATLANAVWASKVTAADITKLTVTAGEVTAADWSALATTLPALTEFTADAAVTVANIPDGASADGTSSSPIFPTSIVSVTVPQAVTIGRYAFAGCSKLTSLSFPNASEVGSSAFKLCGALASVEFPKATTVNTYAFENCGELKSVSLPLVDWIYNYTFVNCVKLESVDFPKATFVGSSAFSNCTLLKTAKIPEATYIGISAFEKCIALESVTIPKTETLSMGAFSGCEKLGSISILGATAISADAFSGCTSLTSASIPRAAEIETNAFKDCTSLATLFVDGTPPTVKTDAFLNCPTPRVLKFVDAKGELLTGDLLIAAQKAFDKVIADGGTATDDFWYGWTIGADPVITVKLNDGTVEYGGANLTVAVNKAVNGVNAYPVTKLAITAGEVTYDDWKALMHIMPVLEHLVIDPAVKVANMPQPKWGDMLFPATMISVSIPQEIEIGNSSQSNVGAFKDCVELTTVDIPNATLIEGNSFKNCIKLTTVNFPKVTTVGSTAFRDCRALKEASFPVANKIGYSAFSDCWELTTVKIPKVTQIEERAFFSCSKLDTLWVGATPPKRVESDAFYMTKSTSRMLKIVDENGDELTGEELTTAQKKYSNADSYTSDNLWYGFTIVPMAFKVNDAPTVYRGPDLKRALSEGGMTEISTITKLYITEGCVPSAEWIKLPTLMPKLTDFIVDPAVTMSIAIPSSDDDKSAFPASIVNVSIPNAWTINEYAFADCTALVSVSLPGVKNVGNNAFEGCTALTSISLPKVSDVLKDAFSGCTALKTVTLPSLTSLYYSVFTGCTGFDTLILGAKPPSVTTSEDPFSDCPTARTIKFVDADGKALTGDALTTAQNTYKAATDGKPYDNLWYGWTIEGAVTDAPAAEWTVTGGATGKGAPEEALDAVKADGGTIKMIADVSRSDVNGAWLLIDGSFAKPITLDLNGKTIAVKGGYKAKGVIGLAGNPAEFKIIDSSTGKTGKIAAENTSAVYVDFCTAFLPNLTLEGGTYSATGKWANQTDVPGAIVAIDRYQTTDGREMVGDFCNSGFVYNPNKITYQNLITYTDKTVTVKVNTFVPVTGVTLNKTELSLETGSSETLTATVAPGNADEKTVTWLSGTPGVATVDANGKVTGVTAGTATITATTKDGSKTATCTVTVKAANVAVTGVTLNKNQLSLQIGASETLTATVAPTNATDKTVTWLSGAPGVATVDANGKVTGVTVGTATITATTKDGGKTATCAVTVTDAAPVVAVTGVTLNKNQLSLQAGASETLTATVAPDNATDKTVTWLSGAPGVATVDANGKVTGVTVGTATITATTKDGGKTATCAVTVTATTTVVAVTGVTLNKTELALTTGGSETLTATVDPTNATDKTVTWLSSATGVATVDENGKVTGVTAGTATITATTKDGGKTATCAVTVTATTTVVVVTGVTLNKTELALTTGGSETLTATVAPDNATNKTVTWLSSAPGVATVDANGKVTGVAAGVAAISVVTKDGGKSTTCTVTVTGTTTVVAVTGVTLNKTELALTTGGSETLTAAVAPDNATDKTVTWLSSAPGVATVDENGKVTGVTAGTATLTVTTKDGGKTATCEVTVTATTAVAVTGVTLNKTELELTTGGSETLTATVAPDNATDKTVTWLSSAPGVATVDANGKVTGVTAGVAAISVVTKDGGKSTTCTVKVTGTAVKPPRGGTVTSPLTQENIDEVFGEGNATVDGDTIIINNSIVVESTIVLPASPKVTIDLGGSTITVREGISPVISIPDGGKADITGGSDSTITGSRGSTGINVGGNGELTVGSDVTVNGGAGGASSRRSRSSTVIGGSGNGGDGVTAGANANVTVEGTVNGGAGGASGGNGGNGVSGGNITVAPGGSAIGGSAMGGNGNGGAGVTTGSGDVVIGGTTAGGSGSGRGNGGDGATVTGGTVTVQPGGLATGGNGGASGGNGGNGATVGDGSTVVNGNASGGNGGSGSDGNADGGNGGNGINGNAGNTIDGTGTATGGNGGAAAGSGAGGAGGEGVGGGATANDSLTVIKGKTSRVEVTGNAGTKVTIPNAGAAAEAVLTKEEKENKDITGVTVLLNVEMQKAPDDKDKVEEVANNISAKTVGAFFDITLQKIITRAGVTEEPINIENSPGEVEISITIPAHMRNGRGHTVIRVHDGKGEALDTIRVGDDLWFKSGLFSTYAIAYTPDSDPIDPIDPVDPPDNSGSGNGGGDSSADIEYNFWMNVKNQILDAKSGDVVKVNAQNYDQIPSSTIEALRASNGVTLVITWSGKVIYIASDKVQKAEPGRIYWPISKLMELHLDTTKDIADVPSDFVNPETGGLYGYVPVTAEGASITQVTARQRKVTPPTAGFERDAFAGTRENPLTRRNADPMIFMVLALAMAAGSAGVVWFCKQEDEQDEETTEY